MKKLFSLIAAVLFAGSMMAGSYTLSFKDSGSSSDNSTKRTTVADIVATGAGYVSAVEATNVYNARVGRGIKLGTSSATGSLELTLGTPVKATSIVVCARRYNDNERTLKIQDKDFEIDATKDSAECTYTYEAATEISKIALASTEKRNYLISVTVNFEGENPDPDPEPEPAKNLGEKTIAEFLALKNTKDTCVLTGVVADIVMDKNDPTKYNKYGNFDLVEGTDSLYIYGLLTAAGEAQKFIEMGIDEGDTLTLKAVYAEYKGNPQAQNAVFVSLKKAPVAMDSIPTTAPAAPKQAEANVLAVFCNHYATNNVNFGISGWAGAYQILELEGTKVAFWKDMTWECIIDPAHVDSAHDFSAYKNLHVDMWAPAPAKIKFVAEAVAGANYKDGIAVDLKKGWNSFDFATAEWPSAYDFKNVKCFVLEQYQNPAGENFEHNPFAITNVYFWNAAEVETITCAKAAEDALAGKTDEVAVKGYVTDIAYAWANGSMSFWMADTKDGGKVFEAYKCAIAKEEDAVIVGDLVIARGTLAKYNTTPELAAGCTVEIIEKAERPDPQPIDADTITVAKAIELTMALDSAATSEKEYVVKGFVVDAQDFSWGSKQQIFFLADDAANAGAQKFEAYFCTAFENGEAIPVLNGDEIYLLGKLTKYFDKNANDFLPEIKNGKASFINKVAGDRTKPEAETITVAKALEIAKGLEIGASTAEVYTIVGYVTAMAGKNADGGWEQYGNQLFWIADAEGSTAASNADGAFEVYQGVADEEVKVGYKISVYTKIKKYNDGSAEGLVESDAKSPVTILEKPAAPELPEGVISCDSAVVLAAQIEDPVEVKSTTTGPEVKVWGYVTYAYNASEKDGKVTQSAWLSDTKGAKSGVIQGAYLEIASMESAVVVGDYVQIEGTLAKYLKEGKDGKPNEVVIEVINGRMCKVGEEGIENVVLTEKAQKVIVDGVLYIIRDNKMYNIQGMQVR